MTDTETWKAVPGYEDMYEVSDLGRVRSVDRIMSCGGRWGGTVERLFRGKILQAFDNGHGYKTVHLADGGARDPRLVHRLVADVFVSKVVGKDFVNHKNGDKGNNSAVNLEWCTRSENMQHAHNTGLLDQHCLPVIGTCVQTGAETRYEKQSYAEIALSSTGKPASAIYRCVLGKQKTAYGRVWRIA